MLSVTVFKESVFHRHGHADPAFMDRWWSERATAVPGRREESRIYTDMKLFTSSAGDEKTFLQW